jgi:uncharacterized membrane-anchored protein
MRARKYIYLVLGILFIFNSIMGAYLLITTDISWLMTCLLMLIIGLLFIIGAYRVQKKINLQKRQALENAFKD